MSLWSQTRAPTARRAEGFPWLMCATASWGCVGEGCGQAPAAHQPELPPDTAQADVRPRLKPAHPHKPADIKPHDLKNQDKSKERETSLPFSSLSPAPQISYAGKYQHKNKGLAVPLLELCWLKIVLLSVWEIQVWFKKVSGKYRKTNFLSLQKQWLLPYMLIYLLRGNSLLRNLIFHML